MGSGTKTGTKISLCFQGYLTDALVTKVTDFTDPNCIRELSVSQLEESPHMVELDDGAAHSRTMARSEFMARLKDGRFAVSLTEMLDAENKRSEIEIFDFEEPE